MSDDLRPGVSAMSAYVPPLRVQLEAWCDWTGNPWAKIDAVVGRSFRVPGPRENTYTMAANAVLRLIRNNDVDPASVGMLALGTESSTDNAAGAVIVRGMVDMGLEALGLPRLSRHVEVPEYKHACLGGVYALKAAVRYGTCEGRDRAAIVVCSDVAEYERGSTGEQTQGAGAVAMLVTDRARLFTLDLARAGSASDYRGPDFRKPFSRHFSDLYAPTTDRLSDFPVFSGKYSTFAYLDETACAVEHMIRNLGVKPGDYYRDVHSLFFHRPYRMMPVQALSFLIVRAMAKDPAQHAALRPLCEEAGVQLDAVTAEASSSPDLFKQVATAGEAVPDPHAATSAAAGRLRKTADFNRLLTEKMSLGADRVAELGNLYSGALPAWIAAGLEEAAATGTELCGKSMAAIGYGSGDAAEAMPMAVVPGWQEAARRIGLADALAGAIDLTRAQYEALHDGAAADGIGDGPRDAFRVARVGEHYGPAFQDLGVEYYEYVPA